MTPRSAGLSCFHATERQDRACARRSRSPAAAVLQVLLELALLLLALPLVQVEALLALPIVALLFHFDLAALTGRRQGLQTLLEQLLLAHLPLIELLHILPLLHFELIELLAQPQIEIRQLASILILLHAQPQCIGLLLPLQHQALNFLLRVGAPTRSGLYRQQHAEHHRRGAAKKDSTAGFGPQ
jgi:hypothetical protein